MARETIVRVEQMAQVVENAVKAVKYLRSRGCEDIEFSPEDAGRSEPDFLYRILEEVIKAGATTLNIPDTVRFPPSHAHMQATHAAIQPLTSSTAAVPEIPDRQKLKAQSSMAGRC